MCDLSELEKLYTTSLWSQRPLSPNDVVLHHLNFTQEASFQTRSNIPNSLNIPYGTRERECIDIIGTNLNNDAPICVYIHGGYWKTKELGRANYSFIADSLHSNNIKTIIVGYELCPDVTVPEIAKEIEAAIRSCIVYAIKNGSKGLYLIGHSVGAQLVALLFTTFVPNLPLAQQKLIKAAILVSGLFDLSSIVNFSINQLIRLDEKIAHQMSPIKHELHNEGGTKFVLAVGSAESKAFQDQTEEFHSKLKDLGFDSTIFSTADVDHFNIIELLQKPEFALTKYIINLIKQTN